MIRITLVLIFSFFLSGIFSAEEEVYPRIIRSKPKQTSTNSSLYHEKEEVEATIKKAPNHVGALLNLGQILIQLQQYEEAKKLYERVIKIDGNYRAYLQLGIIYLWEDQLPLAEKNIEKAQRIFPCQPDVYKGLRSLARSMTKAKEYQKTFELYTVMLKCQPNDPKVNFYVGRLYSWQRDWNQSEFYLKKALSLDPDFYDAEFQLSYVYFWTKRYFFAEETLQKLLKRYPCDRQSMGLLERIARVWTEKKDTLPESLPLFQQLTICYPNDPEYSYQVARIYLLEGKREEAKKEIEKSRKIAPHYENSEILLGQIYMEERRFKAARKILQRYPSNPIAQKLLQENGDTKTTDVPDEIVRDSPEVVKPPKVEKFDTFPSILTREPVDTTLAPSLLEMKAQVENFLNQNPDDVFALLHLGRILLQQRQFKKAENLYERVIEIDNNYRAYLQLAYIDLWNQQTSRAEEKIWEAQKLSPCQKDVYSAYSALAKNLTKEKDYPSSLKVYGKMLECRPQEPRVYFYMGCLYSWQKDWTQAEKYLTKALELNPNYYDAQFQLALVDFWKQDYTQSEQKLTKILQNRPCDKQALSRIEKIGKIWRNEEENYQQSLLIYQQLAACDPTDANFKYQMGRLYALQGQFAEAKKALEGALQIDPSLENAGILLGQIYLKEGNLDLAVSIFQVFPDSKTARKFLELIAKEKAKGEEAIVHIPLIAEEDFRDEEIFEKTPEDVDPLLGPEEPSDVPPPATPEELELEEKPFLTNPYKESDRATYEQMLQDEMTSPNISRLTKLYILTGRIKEAESSLKKQLQKDPNNLKSLVQLGYIYLWQEMDDHAYRIFMRILKIDPCQKETMKGLEDLGYKWRYNRDYFAEATEIYTRLIECNVNTARHYFYLGRLNAWEHNWKQAEKDLKMAIELRPNYTDAQLQLVNLYIWMKRYKEAETILKESHLKPYADENLGRIALLRKDYVQAEHYYKEAIQNDRKSSNAWRGLGNALRGQRLFEESEKALQESVDINPNNQLAWTDLFRVKDYTTLSSGFRHSETVAIEDDPDFQKPVVETFYVNSYAPINFAVTNRLDFELEPKWGYQKEKNLFNISLINYNVDLLSLTAKLDYYWDEKFRFGGYVRLKKGEQIGSTVFPYKQQRRFERGISTSFRFGDHRFSGRVGYSSYLIKNFDIRMAELLTRKNIVVLYSGLIDVYPKLRYGLIVRNSYYNDVLNNKEKERTVWFNFGVPYFEKNWILEYRFKYRAFDKVSDNYWSFRRRERNNIFLSYVNSFRGRTYTNLYYRLGWTKSNGESTPVGLFIVLATVRRTRSHKFGLELEHRIKDTFLFDMSVSYYRSNYVYKSGSAKVGFIWKF